MTGVGRSRVFGRLLRVGLGPRLLHRPRRLGGAWGWGRSWLSLILRPIVKVQ